MSDIKFVELEFSCACGLECRIRCEAQIAESAAPFLTRHCEKAELMVLPGAPLAFYEKRNDRWVEIEAC
jgi:hypothetical protein